MYYESECQIVYPLTFSLFIASHCIASQHFSILKCVLRSNNVCEFWFVLFCGLFELHSFSFHVQYTNSADERVLKKTHTEFLHSNSYWIIGG